MRYGDLDSLKRVFAYSVLKSLLGDQIDENDITDDNLKINTAKAKLLWLDVISQLKPYNSLIATEKKIKRFKICFTPFFRDFKDNRSKYFTCNTSLCPWCWTRGIIYKTKQCISDSVKRLHSSPEVADMPILTIMKNTDIAYFYIEKKYEVNTSIDLITSLLSSDLNICTDICKDNKILGYRNTISFAIIDDKLVTRCRCIGVKLRGATNGGVYVKPLEYTNVENFLKDFSVYPIDMLFNDNVEKSVELLNHLLSNNFRFNRKFGYMRGKRIKDG